MTCYIVLSVMRLRYEPHHDQACLCYNMNIKGVDQPTHPRISTFVVHCLDSIKKR